MQAITNGFFYFYGLYINEHKWRIYWLNDMIFLAANLRLAMQGQLLPSRGCRDFFFFFSDLRDWI